MFRAVVVGLLAACAIARQDLIGQLEGSSVLVTFTSGSETHPALAYDGQGRLIVVWGGFDPLQPLRGQRLNADGTNGLTPFLIAGAGYNPSIAADAAGGFVVVWEQSPSSIFGRRFDAAGVAHDIAFRVNGSTTTGTRSRPKVAVDATGAFVVTWEFAQGSAARQILARRFSSSGSALDSEFRVNSSTTAHGGSPAIAADAFGGFAISWQEGSTASSSEAVLARRYSAAGAPLGGPFRLDAATGSSTGRSRVAFDGQGHLVVAWSQVSPDGIYVRRYDASGSAVGAELRVDAAQRPQMALAGGPGDSFAVIWADATTIYQQFFGAGARPNGPAAPVDSYETGLDLAFGGDGKGRFVVAYSRYPGLGIYTDIYARRSTSPLEAVADEFRVNTATTGEQLTQDVAQSPDGGFIVVWKSGAAGTEDILGQRYDANAVPIGGELVVNSYTSSYQSYPSIVAVPGGYVVAWYGMGAAGLGMYGRRIDATGGGLGSDFQINTYTTNLGSPKLAADAAGSFVAVWDGPGGVSSSFEVYARRYAANGSPLTSEFRVNTYTSNTQRFPRVAFAPDGSFVVVWGGRGTGSADNLDIVGQRFSSSGAAAGGEFLLNQAAGIQGGPMVATDSQGNFVVAWTSYAADGSLTNVVARRYAASGAPLANELLANTYTTSQQQFPVVAVDRANGFVIAWVSLGQDGSSDGVHARRFTKTGEPFGDEFRVNSYTANSQSEPAVSAGKNLVVTWKSALQDGNLDGVYAQVYRAPCRSSDADGDGNLDIADVFTLINYLFAGGQAPVCGGDADGDGSATIADVFYVINYLFAGGPQPI